MGACTLRGPIAVSPQAMAAVPAMGMVFLSAEPRHVEAAALTVEAPMRPLCVPGVRVTHVVTTPIGSLVHTTASLSGHIHGHQIPKGAISPAANHSAHAPRSPLESVASCITK